MLATSTKRGASAPSGVRSAKYFWFVRMVVASTSGGTAMNASSMRPSSGTGHSTRPVTSSSSAGSSRER